MDNKRFKHYSELIQQLLLLCIDSLKKFYLPNQFMFARSAKLDAKTNQLQFDCTDPRNTAIALIALNQLKNQGYHVDFNTDKILHNLIQHYIEHLNYEDISLILWADSIGDKKFLDKIWTVLDDKCAFFKHQSNNANYKTMLMAWLLTALCHYYPFAKNQSDVQALSKRVEESIIRNFNSKTNLFYASNKISRKNLIRAKYDNTLASLSSQTFTIMALAFYSQLFGEKDALHIATQCADTLCNLQGSQGQWWWIYNVEKGAIAEGYPIYSVNQDGTVPMALFALQQALSDNKYEENIYRGLDWILGDNELKTELIDWGMQLIWRGIRWEEAGGLGRLKLNIIRRLNMFASVYFGGLSFEKVISNISDFEIIKEMYSYHPARFLYAFADFR